MNISQLARHLGLSVTTVSRVLSGNAGKYRISAATVARVEEAAARHQVTPDPLGANLRRGSLGMIGLLLPDITNPFFSSLARSIESALRSEGLAVQLSDSAEDGETEVDLLRLMLGRRLDGLILASVGEPSEELFSLIRGSPKPVVMVDRVFPDLDVPTVSLDNAEAGRLAVSHLLEAGHTRIGCLRGNGVSHPDRERFRGIREGLEEAGQGLRREWVAGSGYSRRAGLEGARSILERPERPSAVIPLSGQGILGILHVAEKLGLSIPSDLSVVAFDEQPWSAFVRPPLTTVEQPIEEMAENAVSLLLRQGREVSAGGCGTVLRAGLRFRESVRGC